MASKLTLKNFVRTRAKAIRFFLMPICFVKTKAGWHPECFGQVSGLQSILQESCTTSIWPNPEIVWAKYFAKAKACGHPNSFGQMNGSQNNFKELCKGSCQGHPNFFGADMFCKSESWLAPRMLWASEWPPIYHSGILYEFFLAYSKKCSGEIFCQSKSLWQSQFIWLSAWLPN